MNRRDMLKGLAVGGALALGAKHADAATQTISESKVKADPVEKPKKTPVPSTGIRWRVDYSANTPFHYDCGGIMMATRGLPSAHVTLWTGTGQRIELEADVSSITNIQE